MKGKYAAPSKFSTRKNTLWWTVVALAVMLTLLCVFAFRSCIKDSPIDPAQTQVAKNENSISVPGYEILTFKADTTKQEISLANPPQNTCVFIISLYLEDGTLLWQSDEIKPGKQSNPITLRQPLAKGVYANARLVYECFTDDNEHRQLNGAEMKLNLRVQ